MKKENKEGSSVEKIKRFLGYKEYLFEINWDDEKEKEVVAIKAWGVEEALRKLEKTKDIVNKANVNVLNHNKIKQVRVTKIGFIGIAKKIEQ